VTHLKEFHALRGPKVGADELVLLLYLKVCLDPPTLPPCGTGPGV
jgi:hypothetical protein